jgi:hypothetical protein
MKKYKTKKGDPFTISKGTHDGYITNLDTSKFNVGEKVYVISGSSEGFINETQAFQILKLKCWSLKRRWQKRIRMRKAALPSKIPTQTRDINGDIIMLGDKVGYSDPEKKSIFTVILEGNAFRKHYPDWDETLPKPILDYGRKADKLEFIIIKD